MTNYSDWENCKNGVKELIPRWKDLNETLDFSFTKDEEKFKKRLKKWLKKVPKTVPKIAIKNAIKKGQKARDTACPYAYDFYAIKSCY